MRFTGEEERSLASRAAVAPWSSGLKQHPASAEILVESALGIDAYTEPMQRHYTATQAQLSRCGEDVNARLWNY